MLSQFSCAHATLSTNFLPNGWDRAVVRVKASRGQPCGLAYHFTFPHGAVLRYWGWEKLGSAKVYDIITRCNQQTHVKVGPVGLLVGSAGVRALCGLVVVGVHQSGCHCDCFVCWQAHLLVAHVCAFD